jgi:hypothetical protein
MQGILYSLREALFILAWRDKVLFILITISRHKMAGILHRMAFKNISHELCCNYCMSLDLITFYTTSFNCEMHWFIVHMYGVIHRSIKGKITKNTSVGTVQNFNRKMIERGKIDTLTHTYTAAHFQCLVQALH